MNRPLYGNDVAELYRNTKINLNIHIGCHKGFNPRTFEIIAVLLINRVALLISLYI